MLSQLSTAPPADLLKILPQLQRTLYDLSDTLTILGNEFELNEDSPFVKWLQTTYFSMDGTIVKINLVLSTDPYTDASTPTVIQVRKAAIDTINLLRSKWGGSLYWR